MMNVDETTGDFTFVMKYYGFQCTILLLCNTSALIYQAIFCNIVHRFTMRNWQKFNIFAAKINKQAVTKAAPGMSIEHKIHGQHPCMMETFYYLSIMTKIGVQDLVLAAVEAQFAQSNVKYKKRKKEKKNNVRYPIRRSSR